MVGGKVINVVQLPDFTWVQVNDKTHSQNDTCAIYVEKTDAIKVDDQLWWQGNKAMWTSEPRTHETKVDVQLNKLGYSHSGIPDQIISELMK